MAVEAKGTKAELIERIVAARTTLPGEASTDGPDAPPASATAVNAIPAGQASADERATEADAPAPAADNEDDESHGARAAEELLVSIDNEAPCAKAAEELLFSTDDESRGTKPHEGVPADRLMEYHGGRDYAGNYHGMGRLVTPHSKYVGQFSHGVKHGRGMLVDESGTYVGEFYRGKQRGRGVLVDTEGHRWEADFTAGRPCGKGVFRTLDCGSQFVGELSGCIRHGELIKLGEPDTILTGKWINSTFVKGQKCIMEAHQSGTFDYHSELHGYGKRVLPNGVVERGQFVHGSLKNAVAEHVGRSPQTERILAELTAKCQKFIKKRAYRRSLETAVAPAEPPTANCDSDMHVSDCSLVSGDQHP